MPAEVLGLSPKGSAWLLHHRKYVKNGCVVNWAFVFDFHTGLTAHEAWQKASLRGTPPFYEVVPVQLLPFPLSVNTKPLTARQQKALESLTTRMQRLVQW